MNLTRSSLFHSHLEYLPGLQPSEFSKQVRKRFKIAQKILCVAGLNLKGLGHAILGNFSTDQIVIELTKIRK